MYLKFFSTYYILVLMLENIEIEVRIFRGERNITLFSGLELDETIEGNFDSSFRKMLTKY